MSKTVIGVFDNISSAETAANDIKEKGLKTDDISILAKYKDASTLSDTQSTNTPGKKTAKDNVSDGVVTGSILGGLAGLLIGAGSLIIPGLGIIAAAGPIAGLLSGAVTGGIVGGLIDLGIPEKESQKYETQLKEGKVLFGMRTEDNLAPKIDETLKKNGALKVETY
jgi:uncharacterized membrane protein